MKPLPTPCPSCPWRIDARADEIPNFSLPLAERLRSTCPDERNMGPGFDANWFACHQSRDGADVPCAGWLAQVGHAHPRVRIAVAQDRLPVDVLSPQPGWPALHETYPEVMHKLYETLPDEGLTCPSEAPDAPNAEHGDFASSSAPRS